MKNTIYTFDHVKTSVCTHQRHHIRSENDNFGVSSFESIRECWYIKILLSFKNVEECQGCSDVTTHAVLISVIHDPVPPIKV